MQALKLRLQYIFLGILLTLVILLMLAMVFSREIYRYEDTFDGAELPEINSIVCLAGGRGRIMAASDLWYRYKEQALSIGSHRTPLLFIVGMGNQANWLAFSKQIRPGVLAALDKKDVILENESFNTIENARVVIDFARKKQWERIALVTSPYHMRRATLIMNRILAKEKLPLEIETYSVYTDVFDEDDNRLDLLKFRVSLDEYIKWLYYSNFWRP